MSDSANTLFVIGDRYSEGWEARMRRRTGLCGAALTEGLFYASDDHQSGAPDPTDRAIALARKWEEDPELLFDYLAENRRWCPTCWTALPCQHKRLPRVLKECPTCEGYGIAATGDCPTCAGMGSVVIPCAERTPLKEAGQ